MSFATTIAMKPYLSYKDSRSMWLGKVPADWEVRADSNGSPTDKRSDPLYRRA